MDINKLSLDPTKEIEGVWKPLGDARIKVARQMNPKFRERVRALAEATGSQKARALIGPGDAGEVDPEMIEIIADTVLISWEGFKDGKEDYPPTRENKIALLTSKSTFREIVAEYSNDYDNYRQQVEAAEEGNS